MSIRERLKAESAVNISPAFKNYFDACIYAAAYSIQGYRYEIREIEGEHRVIIWGILE